MSKRHQPLLWSLALSGALMLPAQAQFVVQGSNGSAAALQPIVLTPKKVRALGLTSSVRTDYVSNQQQYFIVAYDRIPTAQAQAEMEKVATYVSYLPENTYIYKAAQAEKAAAAIERLAIGDGLKVLGKGALPLEFKLSEFLYKASLHDADLPIEVQEKGLEVNTFEPADHEPLRQTLTAWGFTLKESENGGFIVTSNISATTAKQIASIPYVLSVREYVEAKSEMAHLNYIIRTNAPHLVHYDHKGPTGRGVYFMNWETYGAEDFNPIVHYGRTLPNASDNRHNSHGSDCGNIAAGANNILEWEGGGMAPGTTILAGGDGTTYANGSGPGVERALNDGLTPIVSNHSVGWGYGTTDYWQGAANIDRITFQSNSFISCYSAGNASDQTVAPYTIPGYGSYSGGIKSNKNGFNVHSVSETAIDVDWASFGPSKDGRMIPQICAQGTGGTSYASPGVAGMVAIVMEQFKETYQIAPRADVVKAVIMNTAIPVRTFKDKVTRNRVDAVNYINYRTGFGQISPTSAVAAIKERCVRFGEKVAQGEVKEVSIDVPADQAELRFMLYWNDVPATAGAAKALINDLDIEVIAPDGTSYLPWTLDPSPERVTDKPVRRENHLDNAEQVVIRAASKDQLLAGGTYKVRIKGYRIPNVRQQPEYVLTWQFRPRGIVMTSLPEGYRVNNSDDLMVTWELTLPDDEDAKALNPTQEAPTPGEMTPQLYYRNNETMEWRKVARSPERYGKNFAYYRIPFTTKSSEVQFEIRVDDITERTNKVMVERRLTDRPKIVSFSPEKVKLSWTKAAGVTEGKYYIHALYDKYMTIVDSVDMPATEKEVAAPAGRQWTTDNFFAISVYNGKTKAQSQRSLPAGIDQKNEWAVGKDNKWLPEYRLCAAEVKPLKTLDVAGNIRWYKKEGDTATPIPDAEQGSARQKDFDRRNPGTYFYTITAEGETEPFYTSPEVTLLAPAIELEDTAVYGDGVWEGYVFNNPGGNGTSETLLKPNAGIYGKFTLKYFGFDSAAEGVLFPWDKPDVTGIPNYIGCSPGMGRNDRVIVLKRKNFAPGKYTFIVKRAAQRVRLIFRDRLGKVVKNWLSEYNYTGEARVPVTLDENSTCELHWLGDHMIMDVETPAFVAPTFTGLESGKYYRLMSAYPKFYEVQGTTKGMYLKHEDHKAAWQSTDKTNVSQLWKITENAAYPSVSISNANFDLYLGKANVAAATTPSQLTLKPLAEHQFNILSENSGYYATGHFQGKASEGTIYATNQGLNTPAAWYLEKATTIQLRVGEKGYNSACFPFAVRVPNMPHFAVYTVAGFDENGNVIKGDLYPANTVLPANTPVIIGALPALYEFAIEADNTDIAPASLLRGIRPGEKPAGNTYVLGHDPEKGVGFVPASSAYALAGATGANRVTYTAPEGASTFIPLRLAPVTGIDLLQGEAKETNSLHDASGRKLHTAPQRGFYIQDGKKVLK